MRRAISSSRKADLPPQQNFPGASSTTHLALLLSSPGRPPYTGHMASAAELLTLARRLPPRLTFDKYKGQAGKTGTLGGCADYTGAPYYAAAAALYAGVDLSHVFCAEGASVPIKCYSPELIVHGCLSECGAALEPARVEQLVASTVQWLPSMTSLVCGPGLGRDAALRQQASAVVRAARTAGTPLVLDADGINVLVSEPELVRDYPGGLAIVTPNVVEFGRLCDALLPPESRWREMEARVATETLAVALGHVVLVRKGPVDLITDGRSTLLCDEEGAPKRCGGQGDVLAGLASAFLSWSQLEPPADAPPPTAGVTPTLLAAWAACLLTRRCALAAFDKRRRAMSGKDLLEEIPAVMQQFAPVD